jgi:hypothetical protein
MGVELLRANSLTKVFGILHRAIADLELQVPTIGEAQPAQVRFSISRRCFGSLASAMERSLSWTRPG